MPQERQLVFADGLRQGVAEHRIHRKLEYENTVATRGDRCQGVVVGSRRTVAATAPLERQLVLTDGLRKSVAEHRVHRKLQHEDAVATRGDRRQGVVVGPRRTVTAAVPLERQLVFADGLREGIAEHRIHRELQHIDAVTTRGNRRQGVVVGPRRAIAATAPQERQLVLADGLRQGVTEHRIHGELQHEDAVAARGNRHQGVIVGPRRIVTAAVPQERQLVLTNSLRQRVAEDRVYHQLQHPNAVATRGDRCQGVIVGSRRIVAAAVPQERQLVFTNGLRQGIMKNRVHHKLQHIDAVAARHDRDEGIVVGSRGAVTASPPQERRFGCAYNHRQRVAEHGIHLHQQRLDAVGTSGLHGLGNGDRRGAIKGLVVPKERCLIGTNSRVVMVYDRKMQGNHTVGTVNGMQQRVLAASIVECQPFPYERQLGGVDGVVQIDVFVRINMDVNDSVKGTPVFVNQREGVSHHGVVRQIPGRRDDKRGVASAGTRPQPVEKHLRHVRVMGRRQMLRHPQLTLEDITVVDGDTVNHLNRPYTVDRTTYQTVKRFIGVVVLRARSHIGGIDDDTVQMVYILNVTRIVIDGIAGVHQTAIGGSILVPFGGVVRPAIVPAHTGQVPGGITPMVSIIRENVRLTNPGLDKRILVIIDLIDIPVRPSYVRTVDETQTLRLTVVVVFPQNVRLLSIRTLQPDVKVDWSGMLHIQADVADFVSRMDDRGVRESRKGHLRLVGAAEGLTGHTVRQERDGCIGERGLRQGILQVVALQRADDHCLRVPGHHVVEEAIHDGVFGFEQVETGGHGRTAAGIVGGYRVNARLRHGDRGSCRTVAPKVGLRSSFGNSRERHGGVRTEEMRPGNNDVRRCDQRQMQGVRTGTALAVGVFVNINPFIRVSCAMPLKAVAGGHGFHLMGAVTDDQMQRHRAVRAVLVCVYGVVCPCLSEYPPVPIVTVASGFREHIGGGVVNRQVQGIDLLAAVGIIVTTLVCSRLHVRVAVAVHPHIAVVCGNDVGLGHRVVDGQVQDHRTVAAVRARPCPVVVSAGVVGCAVPRVAHALRHRLLGVRRLQDGQMQRHHTVAAGGTGERLRVIAAGRIDIHQDIAVKPLVVLAFRGIYLIMLTAGYGQMQRIDLHTAVGILVGVGVVAGCRVGLPVPVRPGEGAASSGFDLLSHRVEDGQVQGRRAVAAVHARPCPIVISSGGVCCAVPRVTHALRYRLLSVGRGQDGQM